jgi:hypothetical protein
MVESSRSRNVSGRSIFKVIPRRSTLISSINSLRVSTCCKTSITVSPKSHLNEVLNGHKPKYSIPNLPNLLDNYFYSVKVVILLDVFTYDFFPSPATESHPRVVVPLVVPVIEIWLGTSRFRQHPLLFSRLFFLCRHLNDFITAATFSAPSS